MKNGPESKQNSDEKNKKRNRSVLKRVIFVLAGLVFAVLTINAVMFAAGIKTGFFHRWVEGQYFGKIAEIQAEGFIIRDQEGEEKSVLIRKDTRIRRGRQTVAEEALEVGSYVIVVGSSNDSKQIEARVIRIFADD
ncbi:MAG: hypothetical protein HYT40_01270 [Candidatus Sungbacteria bacterium]|uniref:DUF5666 domain-containing protein n=1 Tax=Candidatus Sungiibacteriota bacterium TaxID=2750080 RepID=A0A931SB51_9BACT|nr:hypothetical protein [Candidatus Sungbacteria bacterium]